jgi:hypothetical protein
MGMGVGMEGGRNALMRLIQSQDVFLFDETGCATLSSLNIYLKQAKTINMTTEMWTH